MAVAYGTSASATLAATGGADNLTITKPASLAAGDFMFAFCGRNGGGASFTAPGGWTTLFTTDDGSNYGLRVFWKIASAGDASASNFSFSITASSGDGLVGAMVRATGSGFTGLGNLTFTSDNNASANTNHTFTPGIVPPSSDALYIMGSYIRGDTTQSGYAIAANNPSWTERVDTSINTSRDSGLSIATAIATSIAASGDFSITLASSFEAIGFLIAIEENTSVTVNPAVLSATFSILAPTVIGGAAVTIGSAITATFTVQAPTVTFPVSDISNQDKHNAIFDNLEKS